MVKNNLNPIWNEEIDFAILPNLNTYILEVTCWDRGKVKKEYLGEFEIDVRKLFTAQNVARENADVHTYQLVSFKSGRKSSKVSGCVQLRFWLHNRSRKTDNQTLWWLWNELATTIDAKIGRTNSATDDNGLMPLDEDLEELSIVDNNTPDTDDTDEIASNSDLPTRSRHMHRRPRIRLRRKKGIPLQFNTSDYKDVLGVVFMEIDSCADLPPERNLTRTGFDMDPFCVVSFGKKTFRTRVVRHSLTPVWNDKLMFQVQQREEQYNVNFRIVDRDKLSGNDPVGTVDLPIRELIANGPQADPITGLYRFPKSQISRNPSPAPKKRFPLLNRVGGSSVSLTSLTSTTDSAQNCVEFRDSRPESQDPIDNMQSFHLPIVLSKKDRWEDRHKPELHVKANFVPYPALRQQFWRSMLRQYDTDDTGAISRLELMIMLDTLGATLKDSTIDKFFRIFTSKENALLNAEGEPDVNPELTIDQCVICLEEELHRQRKPVSPEISPSMAPSSDSSSTIDGDSTDSMSSSIGEKGQVMPPSFVTSGDGLGDDELADDETGEEYLITLTQCPLCQKSQLAKRSGLDIVTHLAICASQDWRKVDRLVMGNFVTSSQAQRKWYTKVISRMTYGGYKLGANSANILVQDRVTGQVQEERMSVYVRLGIRLMYKGMKSSRMEGNRIRKMLKSLSIKQGRKYDSPSSARDIKAFIDFHQLNMDEVLLPFEAFKTFNAFFYRKLKPGTRPCAEPNDSRIVVSPSDCRSVVFNTISHATEIWVKGQNFSMKRLLGGAYPDDAPLFAGGAMGIFRLAPQDYHRFHVSVDGIMGEPRTISGQYYTVNPMAIRSGLDVYGENARVLVPIDTKEFGRVMVVCVGAMMVGSTVITAKTGCTVKRTDELGYFAFGRSPKCIPLRADLLGGSTIILLFQPGKLVFDDDLVYNSERSIETLLRVGSSIGHPPGMVSHAAEKEKKTVVTEQDREEASRRIAGSFPPPQDTRNLASSPDLLERAGNAFSVDGMSLS